MTFPLESFCGLRDFSYLCSRNQKLGSNIEEKVLASNAVVVEDSYDENE